jgi:hypothetical protein
VRIDFHWLCGNAIRCRYFQRASLRRRPPDQPSHDARDDCDHDLHAGLVEDRSSVRALYGAHQDQAHSRAGNPRKIPEELLADFELDHRIPLALGGAPSDPRNLELQPWDEAGEEDQIEVCLSRAVCGGTITLDEARRRMWADWRGWEGLPMR